MLPEHYHYGFNMPGYMPDSDPVATDDWDVAYDCMMFDIGQELDDMFNQGMPLHECEAVVLEVEKTARYAMPYYYALGKYAYWIEVCDRLDCETIADELDAILMEVSDA